MTQPQDHHLAGISEDGGLVAESWLSSVRRCPFKHVLLCITFYLHVVTMCISWLLPIHCVHESANGLSCSSGHSAMYTGSQRTVIFAVYFSDQVMHFFSCELRGSKNYSARIRPHVPC